MKEVVDRTSSIEKCSLPQPASMAQLVERSAVNRQVLGSIPSGGVFFTIVELMKFFSIDKKEERGVHCSYQRVDRKSVTEQEYCLNNKPDPHEESLCRCERSNLRER